MFKRFRCYAYFTAENLREAEHLTKIRERNDQSDAGKAQHNLLFSRTMHVPMISHETPAESLLAITEKSAAEHSLKFEWHLFCT
jgi:hypothetical protein